MAPNQPRPTKAERRDAARAKAQALREEQARRQRRATITRRSLLGVGALAVVGVGAGLYVSGRDSGGSSGTSTYSPATAAATGPGVPSGVMSDGSVSFGQALTPGTVNEGAPVVDVWYDYSCPHCAEFEALHSSELTALATSASATIVLRPVKILGQAWTDTVDNALGVVIDQEPDKAMAFHTAAFSLYEQAVAAENAALLSQENLVTYAQSAGVSSATTDQFSAAVSANTYGAWTQLGTKAFEDNGLTGTPTIRVNGTEVDLKTINTATGVTDYLKDKGLVTS